MFFQNTFYTFDLRAYLNDDICSKCDKIKKNLLEDFNQYFIVLLNVCACELFGTVFFA